ncbi:acetate kinase [Amycolatopsis sp. NPDC006131]|uniref:acetate/propionate family kinase n=1 Tax=Amycolatopsis sp. NPDC006131 TaxID=3156731 RepID=UPI0033B3F3B8
MRILTLNPGSSSLKAAMHADGAATATRTWEAADATADEQAISRALEEWPEPDAVAVRFVHGGSRPRPVVLDEHELGELERLTPLAPLHQPLSVHTARVVRALLPGTPVIACFDTSFHSGLPDAAARYALPHAWTSQNRLRRYGFHGLSCRHALRHAAELLGRAEEQLSLVVAHVGAGVSVTAIRDGSSVDTSMGFTALEGAAMATRSGSVDPGLLLHVLGTSEVTLPQLRNTLYRESGLAGMTGTSGDLREVLAADRAGDRNAHTALAVYRHRLRREIGAMAMSLERLDAVVFTGGVAEHQPAVVGEIVAGCALLGLTADPGKLAAEGDRVVSTGEVPVLILTAREDLELARGAEALLSGARRPDAPAGHAS